MELWLQLSSKILPGYKKFKPSEYIYLRIIKGVITENYPVPGDFNFKNIPEDISPGLKRLFDEFKNNVQLGLIYC